MVAGTPNGLAGFLLAVAAPRTIPIHTMLLLHMEAVRVADQAADHKVVAGYAGHHSWAARSARRMGVALSRSIRRVADGHHEPEASYMRAGHRRAAVHAAEEGSSDPFADQGELRRKVVLALGWAAHKGRGSGPAHKELAAAHGRTVRAGAVREQVTSTTDFPEAGTLRSACCSGETERHWSAGYAKVHMCSTSAVDTSWEVLGRCIRSSAQN